MHSEYDSDFRLQPFIGHREILKD